MANLAYDQQTGRYKLVENIESSTQIRRTLHTQNNFLDKDIDVEINTPAGALSAGATTLTINDEDNLITVSTEEPESGEYITVEGQGAVSASQGGFIAQNTSQNSTAATKYITIQDAAFTVDGAAVKSTQAGLVGANETVGTIGNAAQTIAGGGLTPGDGNASATSEGLSDGSAIDATSKITLSETNAAGYYKINVNGYGSVNRAAVTKQVTTPGYMAGDADPVTTIAAGSETSNTATKAYYIQQSTLSTNSVTPTTSAQTVTIGPGYHHAERTVKVGPISAGPKATITSGAASLGALTFTYNTTNSNFDISGTAIIAAPSVGTEGFIGTNATASVGGTKNGNSNTVTQTVAKIAGTASISATSIKPSITKRDVPSGVTQAASGAATTTAPSSGVYVAVKSDANTTSLTPTVSISTAGYGTSTQHGITGSAAQVGAAASDTTYVPITTSSVKVDGGILTNQGATATLTRATASNTDASGGVGVKIATSGSAGRAKITYAQATNGWVTLTNGSDATGGGAISASSWDGDVMYLTGVTLIAPTTSGKTNDFNITVPNGNSTVTFKFSVDTSGNVTITDS